MVPNLQRSINCLYSLFNKGGGGGGGGWGAKWPNS